MHACTHTHTHTQGKRLALNSEVAEWPETSAFGRGVAEWPESWLLALLGQAAASQGCHLQDKTSAGADLQATGAGLHLAEEWRSGLGAGCLPWASSGVSGLPFARQPASKKLLKTWGLRPAGHQETLDHGAAAPQGAIKMEKKCHDL